MASTWKSIDNIIHEEKGSYYCWFLMVRKNTRCCIVGTVITNEDSIKISLLSEDGNYFELYNCFKNQDLEIISYKLMYVPRIPTK